MRDSSHERTPPDFPAPVPHDGSPDAVLTTPAGGNYHRPGCPSLTRAYGEPEQVEVGREAIFWGRRLRVQRDGRELEPCGRCGGGWGGR